MHKRTPLETSPLKFKLSRVETSFQNDRYISCFVSVKGPEESSIIHTPRPHFPTTENIAIYRIISGSLHAQRTVRHRSIHSHRSLNARTDPQVTCHQHLPKFKISKIAKIWRKICIEKGVVRCHKWTSSETGEIRRGGGLRFRGFGQFPLRATRW